MERPGRAGSGGSGRGRNDAGYGMRWAGAVTLGGGGGQGRWRDEPIPALWAQSPPTAMWDDACAPDPAVCPLTGPVHPLWV